MEKAPQSQIVPFSLVKGDFVDRAFSRLGLRGPRGIDLVGRSITLWLATWVPMAVIALLEGFWTHRSIAENFFCDIAAYAQLFVGLPLFVVAEGFISARTRDAAHQFSHSGIVRADCLPQLAECHRKLEFWRKSTASDIVCGAIAYILAYITLLPLLSDPNLPTWHTQVFEGHKILTWAGKWELWITLPLIDYWWLRWIWKTGLWCWYLYKVSQLPLILVASHPDRTGGLGFVSRAQTTFGLLILAYGVTNVAATVAHELIIEKLDVDVTTVWGPMVSFVIGAPLLFTVPLFAFTAQLYRAKRKAIVALQEKALGRASMFEKKWLRSDSSAESYATGTTDLSGMSSLNSVFDRIHSMRVVPFDLRSFGELVGSAVGPILPLLPYLKVLPDPVMKSIERITKFLGG